MGKRLKKAKRADIKKNISETFELPGEIVLNMPLISLRGREEAVIENYRGIIEYSPDRIRINTTAGIFRLTGENLFIKCLDADNIVVAGKIISAEFL